MLAGKSPLEQFDYGDVVLTSDLHEKQLDQTHAVLMGLSDDSLLKPLRQMSGQPAPGEDLGGWYHYSPDYQWGKDDDGFAPSCTFGQWVSALARMYAIRRDQPTRDKVLRLNRLYAQTISGDYYEDTLVIRTRSRFSNTLQTLHCPTFPSMRSNTAGTGGQTRIRVGHGTNRTQCRKICFWHISAALATDTASWGGSILTTSITIRYLRAAMF
jgi:hypothetical protein